MSIVVSFDRNSETQQINYGHRQRFWNAVRADGRLDFETAKSGGRYSVTVDDRCLMPTLICKSRSRVGQSARFCPAGQWTLKRSSRNVECEGGSRHLNLQARGNLKIGRRWHFLRT